MAHVPADGEKVYCAVPGFVVLIVVGDHVPVMPFVAAGNAGATTPWQTDGMALNAGVNGADKVTQDCSKQSCDT